MLTSKTILSYLAANKDFLKQQFNVIKIGIFGSYARNEADEDSDIDILVEFDENTEDLFDKRFELKEYLKSVFKKDVDVCRESAIKPVFRVIILKDAIYA